MQTNRWKAYIAHHKTGTWHQHQHCRARTAQMQTNRWRTAQAERVHSTSQNRHQHQHCRARTAQMQTNRWKAYVSRAARAKGVGTDSCSAGLRWGTTRRPMCPCMVEGLSSARTRQPTDRPKLQSWPAAEDNGLRRRRDHLRHVGRVS
jgi:hypothetical protein